MLIVSITTLKALVSNHEKLAQIRSIASFNLRYSFVTSDHPHVIILPRLKKPRILSIDLEIVSNVAKLAA